VTWPGSNSEVGGHAVNGCKLGEGREKIQIRRLWGSRTTPQNTRRRERWSVVSGEGGEGAAGEPAFRHWGTGVSAFSDSNRTPLGKKKSKNTATSSSSAAIPLFDGKPHQMKLPQKPLKPIGRDMETQKEVEGPQLEDWRRSEKCDLGEFGKGRPACPTLDGPGTLVK